MARTRFGGRQAVTTGSSYCTPRASSDTAISARFSATASRRRCSSLRCFSSSDSFRAEKHYPDQVPGAIYA
ncbi:hypothetical protein E2C01_007690 [Portunus trituberculatus]|uniref:Uncharacterized protein n=1 Tax=Portunus trituberculatus TaxID=210409 RepID=A0A5B7D4P1_PORTR|nr:hypothetical protein [Portunus trituberculatus]